MECAVHAVHIRSAFIARVQQEQAAFEPLAFVELDSKFIRLKLVAPAEDVREETEHLSQQHQGESPNSICSGRHVHLPSTLDNMSYIQYSPRRAAPAGTAGQQDRRQVQAMSPCKRSNGKDMQTHAASYREQDEPRQCRLLFLEAKGSQHSIVVLHEREHRHLAQQHGVGQHQVAHNVAQPPVPQLMRQDSDDLRDGNSSASGASSRSLCVTSTPMPGLGFRGTCKGLCDGERIVCSSSTCQSASSSNTRVATYSGDAEQTAPPGLWCTVPLGCQRAQYVCCCPDHTCRRYCAQICSKAHAISITEPTQCEQ